MNLYVMIAVVAGLVFSHGFMYRAGGKAEQATQLRIQGEARGLAEEVRGDIAALSTTLAEQVLTGFKGISVTNTTSVRNIYNEKEVHRVLSNPECAWPVSTLRVRNEPRFDPDPDYRARQHPDAGVRKPGAAPGVEAAVAR